MPAQRQNFVVRFSLEREPLSQGEREENEVPSDEDAEWAPKLVFCEMTMPDGTIKKFSMSPNDDDLSFSREGTAVKLIFTETWGMMLSLDYF